MTKKDRIDMIQLGFNPLLEADIQRYFSGQPPLQDRSRLYEGEEYNMGQANMTERDMGSTDYANITIGQEVSINPEDDVIEKPIQPNTNRQQRPMVVQQNRQVLTEDDDFGLPKRQTQQPNISKEQLQKRGLDDATEYLRLVISALQTNQPKARHELANKLNSINQFMAKLDQNSKVYYNQGLAKKEKALLARFQ